MVVVTGKYPQAQLVGLQGLGTLGPIALRQAAMPPGVQATVKALTPQLTQDSSAGPVTNYGVSNCVPGVSAPCTCPDGTAGTHACGSDFTYAPCACGKKTNWLLWGGLALGAVVAWRILR